MTGVKWKDLSEAEFVRIVNAILERVYDGRGFAPEGRGGDDGRDYTVDDDRIIYQYKFWPDGNNTHSRQRQIRRSFEAMKHHPDEWHLVIPAQILDNLRKFVVALGDGQGVKISLHDQAWLDNKLSEYPTLAEYFQYRSADEYVFGKAELLKENPFVRTGEDVAAKQAALQANIDAADPNWTFDIATENGMLVRTLRAQTSNAARLSPVTVTYDVAAAGVSEEFVSGLKYGFTAPMRLAGSTIQNFKVSGPPLVAFEGPVDEIELRPTDDGSSPWQTADLRTLTADGRLRRVHAGRARILAAGTEGFTLELELANGLVHIWMRCPKEQGESGRFEIQFKDVTGRTTSDVLALSRFSEDMREGRSAAALYIDGKSCMRFTLHEPDDAADGADTEIALLAEDLDVIEHHFPNRFRFPSELTEERRIWIRNVRLMLEGTSWPIRVGWRSRASVATKVSNTRRSRRCSRKLGGRHGSSRRRVSSYSTKNSTSAGSRWAHSCC